MIEPHPPTEWRELQERVARILRECGMTAETDRKTSTTRGDVDIDVFAVDSDATPPATTVVECKHWKRAVPQTIIHGFRTVVTDIGANLGIIVSSAGFQSGAETASQFTNLNLVEWQGFEAIFEKRWYEQYLVPTLRRIVDPLLEYTDPINTRIFRKANALSEHRQQRFGDLRDKYMILGVGFMPALIPFYGMPAPAMPPLPLRAYPKNG